MFWMLRQQQSAYSLVVQIADVNFSAVLVPRSLRFKAAISISVRVRPRGPCSRSMADGFYKMSEFMTKIRFYTLV